MKAGGNGGRMREGGYVEEESLHSRKRVRMVKLLGKNKTTAPGRDRTGNLEKSFIIVHHRIGIVL